mmetsp:Transcript_51888/g.131776  ORF Transcript_51888/g.131776 Transcript_51888/m.131776 type:complete len:512 (+) Transcript_51888:57-1592(+)
MHSRLLVLLVLPVLAAALSPAPRLQNKHRFASILAIHQNESTGEKALSTDDVVARVEQAPSVVRTSTSTSWLQRLQDSLTTFVIGLVLIVFSIPVLWFNESRVAQMESLISIGKSQARSVGGKAAVTENRNWLVHVDGETAKSAATVSDPQFDVSFNKNCIRLSSTVEVYQIIEHSKNEEREKLGGGKETTTTYTYTEEWSSSYRDSGSYQDVSKRINRKPQGLEVGVQGQDCSRVEFGEGFLLPEELIGQCTNWRSAGERLPEAVNTKGSRLEFKRADQQYFYCRSSQHDGHSQLGDARVSFRYVPDHEATVLALQADGSEELRDTFMPYRLIRRGWFGLDEDVEKKALLKQAKKSYGDLARDSSCTGCLACLCCACNMVVMCCQSRLAPELYHLFDGSLDLDECFAIIASRLAMTKWCFRVAGWMMIFIGLYSLFAPFLTLLKVIPFLGPLAASLGGALIYFLCFLCTAIIASAIVIVAYLFYRPIMALVYGVLSAAAVTGVCMLASKA